MFLFIFRFLLNSDRMKRHIEENHPEYNSIMNDVSPCDPLDSITTPDCNTKILGSLPNSTAADSHLTISTLQDCLSVDAGQNSSVSPRGASYDSSPSRIKIR